MLFQHITGTRYVYHQFGVEASYTKYFYIASNHPEMGETGPMVMKILLSVMVVFVWYHSCMGMDKWLRLKSGTRKSGLTGFRWLFSHRSCPFWDL